MSKVDWIKLRMDSVHLVGSRKGGLMVDQSSSRGYILSE